MFKKTQEAAVQLSSAAITDTNEAINTAKAMIVPAVAGFFNSIATAATKAKENVESGEFLNKAKAAVADAVKPEAAPFPTAAENDAIKVLRTLGKTDEEIAKAVGVSVLTVKMAV